MSGHMCGWCRFLSSSIGLKQVMGFSGLMLSGFVLIHMSGNLLMFLGSDAYNTYSHSLTSNHLIWIARAGLIVFFLSHIINGIRVTIRNRAARPGGGYAVAMGPSKKASLFSRTMAPQGIVILVFLILHLATFSLGTYYETTVNGVVMRDLFRLVIEVFQNPAYVVWYIFSMFILAFHLNHGFASCLQTLGLNHPRYNPSIRVVSIIYGWLVMIGFTAVPVYVFFGHHS